MASPSLFPFPPPSQRLGVGCYHPDPPSIGEDYPEDSFDKLIAVEDGHFWFEIRNQVLRHAVETCLTRGSAGPVNRTFLEIGCGTGKVLSMLADLPGVSAAGAEGHAAGAALAALRVPKVEIVQLDVLQMDFMDAFDAVGVFDVLEHLEDDIEALERIRTSLKPDGLCFITVPQHPSLWSTQDDIAGHKRRYTRRMLNRHLASAGFEPVVITSFFTAIMPFLVASRVAKQIKQRFFRIDEAHERMSEMEISPGLNRLLSRISSMDMAFLRRGVSLPFGGSLLAVARKS